MKATTANKARATKMTDFMMSVISEIQIVLRVSCHIWQANETVIYTQVSSK